MTAPLAWLIDVNVASEMMRPRPEPRVASFPDSITGAVSLNGSRTKNIPHRCGIENVGVEKGGEARHRAPYPMS